MDPAAPRAELHEAIQQTLRHESGPPEGSVLLGWVLIAEVMAPSGDCWLSRVSAEATGTKDSPPWRQKGYLADALFEPQNFDDDPEDT